MNADQRISISRHGDDTIDIEISRLDRSLFWALWLIAVTAIAIAAFIDNPFLRHLPSELALLPFWGILPVGFLLMALAGLNGLMWSLRGKEVLALRQDGLLYERNGWWFDSRRRELARTTISKVEPLTFGLGDNFLPNRVRVKAGRKTLYLGRDLSNAEATEICNLIRQWASGTSVP